VHRGTPLMTAFRAFSAGGARSVVDKVNDGTLMQEMAGNFMKGETRDGVEAPQNYGFTSVVADAVKGADGMISESAEAFISFIGGNRSFPVAAIMDDRRHRLKELEKGDTALFGLKEWGQQFHINKLGMFLSGNVDRKIRIGLVENDDHNKGQQQSGASAGTQAAGPGVSALATGDGSTGGSSAGGQQSQAKGQKKLYDKTAETEIEVTKDKITIKRGKGHCVVTNDAVMTYYNDDTISTRVDSEHAHIRCGSNRIFVDTSGCWSTSPINIKVDPKGVPLVRPSVEELLLRIAVLEAKVAELQAQR